MSIFIICIYFYYFYSFESNIEKYENLKSKIEQILGGRVGNKPKGQSVCSIFILLNCEECRVSSEMIIERKSREILLETLR